MTWQAVRAAARPAAMASSERVAEARSTLRVALQARPCSRTSRALCIGADLRFAPQVAAEAHADGLLSPAELRETVGELRGTYAATLAALGVDAAVLPDPADSSDGGDAPYDDEYDDDEFYDAPGQARGRLFPPFHSFPVRRGFAFAPSPLFLAVR